VASETTDLLKSGRSANPALPLTAVIDLQETVAYLRKCGEAPLWFSGWNEHRQPV
jgi:hypothetical protein